jgi:hypothetical protein
MFARTRILVAVTLAVVAGPFAATASAQSPKETMARLLDDKDRAKGVLLFLHLGADLSSHKQTGSGKVKNRNGAEAPGHFYLEYEYTWKAAGDTGHTTLSYFFNDKGTLTEIQVDKTDAILNQPFLLADASIAVLGEALNEGLKDYLSDTERRLLRRLVDAADSKGLLQFGLRINLANSR